jgi:hypothetical protein
MTQATAKDLMTRAARACLRSDPQAIQFTEEALAALRGQPVANLGTAGPQEADAPDREAFETMPAPFNCPEGLG